MRYSILAITFIIIAAVVGGMSYQIWQSPPPIVLPTPTHLQAVADGTSMTSVAWTNVPRIDFSVGSAATAAGADLEIRPARLAFHDASTAVIADPGAVATTCRTCLDTIHTRLHLADGTYHWQARLHNGQGVSRWAPAAGLIRIDTMAPVITTLASPTDPNPATVYHQSTMRFTWQGADTASGIEGYSYRLDHDPHAVPAADIRTGSTTVTLHGLDTGTWYFHLRALDRAGNWGATKTFPVRIDVTPPGLTHVLFDRYTFDPQYHPLAISFAVTKPAQTVHVGVYHQDSSKLVRLYTLNDAAPGKILNLQWDGKDDHGQYAPDGTYEVYIRATDAYGHTTLAGWRDFIVTYKRIVVSLSQQKLWAYDGTRLFVSSLVTTGNKALPTPTGTYTIIGKFHPFTFRSPWPKSSPFYYPPSPTQWAMLWRAGGYFIHDAPWRSVFGPGSNAQLGTPGQNYTGTHGCINVPSNVAQELYAWAPIGTIVVVKN